MGIEQLRPEGFTDDMRTFALWSRPGGMYVQGFSAKNSACGSAWMECKQ